MSPAASLRESADRFARLGQAESAFMTRRMAEQAAIWPELYAHWAKAQRERADQQESTARERREANNLPTSNK